jgi:hypothetical protein
MAAMCVSSIDRSRELACRKLFRVAGRCLWKVEVRGDLLLVCCCSSVVPRVKVTGNRSAKLGWLVDIVYHSISPRRHQQPTGCLRSKRVSLTFVLSLLSVKSFHRTSATTLKTRFPLPSLLLRIAPYCVGSKTQLLCEQPPSFVCLSQRFWRRY